MKNLIENFNKKTLVGHTISYMDGDIEKTGILRWPAEFTESQTPVVWVKGRADAIIFENVLKQSNGN